MRLRNVIFYVEDIEKSKKFYDKLGFEVAQDFGNFVSYKTETENLWFSIMQSDSPEKAAGKQVCVFWTEDIKNLYQQMKTAGVFINTELYEASFGQTFTVRDINGNKIEFVQQS